MDVSNKKVPFQKVEEFTGTIYNEFVIVENLFIVITYHEDKSGPISGKVIGSDEIYQKMNVLYNSPSRNYKLEANSSGKKITSKNLNFKRLTQKITYDSVAKNLLYEVASFELLDLEILHERDFDNKERVIVFSLFGPTNVWQVFQIKTLNSNGEIKNDIKNYKLNICKGFSIKLEPEYFYDDHLEDENIQLSTNIISLIIKTKIEEDELPDEKFIKKSQDIADKLILLGSFLCKSWIVWYKYSLVTHCKIVEYYKRTRKTEIKKINFDEYFINDFQIKDFLNSAFLKLTDLKLNGYDLTLPITYFINSKQAIYLEEEFVTSFLSLEKIKDYYSIKNKLYPILRNNNFKKIKKILTFELEKNITDPVKLERMIQKLPDLNRPTLKSVIMDLLNEFNVIWTDIYPISSDFSLISTRDKLVHSIEKIKIDNLFKEVMRLEILLIRLILSMLGWKDLSKTAKQYQIKFLTKNEV